MNLALYAWREITKRPGRTFLNALGVSFGVALVILLFSITLAYKEAVMVPFTTSSTDITLTRPGQEKASVPVAQGVILPASNQAIGTDVLKRLAQMTEVKQTATVLELWSFDPGRFKVIVGLDPNSQPLGPAKVREWVKEGRFFGSGERGVAVLDSHYARFFGYKVGSQIIIAGQKFNVIGTCEMKEGAQLTAANIYLPLTDAQILAGVGPETVNSVYVELKDASRWKQSIDTIHQVFPEVTVTSADSALAMSDSILALLDKLAWPGAVLVIALSVLFVHRSLAASTWERIGEFGTMKALGWSRRDIQRALMLELFSQVLIGSVLGLGIAAIGSLLAGHWQVNISPVGSAPPLPGMAPSTNTIQLPVVFSTSLYLSALGSSLLVGLIVAVTIAQKVVEIKPAEAWRHL
ncbi:ABC-type transport system, involved in lipoprotein release, permease component [Desulfosporosinus acidiphilus SJ4]|uniref:ABC-type transport system, involved in lipoprotein release, permease component n=1 Tax=Desulfosporosinus acidiphilus (strain DSM 22704 / JCM 16185 / SJ4) TaxID=646529 RepID=I4D1G5_DESAJ|nr:ABC transporter permease [Desulfosporosinus acidiphilus]AFM39639.1 ABC-type transport system, involved in lipoprotein release, permease component [Desulfosporosinus acidiphilus SJ4]